MRSLDIRFTGITDVSPLGRVPMDELSFYPSRIACGLDPLLRIGSLVTTINRRHAEAFWMRHGGEHGNHAFIPRWQAPVAPAAVPPVDWTRPERPILP